VAGAIARRIVTDLGPGERVKRGERFGMIKFGSRTDLLVPAKDLAIEVKVGDVVKGGASVLARFPAVETPPPSGMTSPATAETTLFAPPAAATSFSPPPAGDSPASEIVHGS
jgi:hypothetical protein